MGLMGNNSTQYKTITEEEKAMLVKSWDKVRSDLNKSGANLFVVVYMDFPKMGNFFPFRGPQEDAFQQHMTVLLREIDRMVGALDNPDELGELLFSNASSHQPRNISKDDYNKLKIGFLKMLKAQLGTDTFNKELQNTWEKSLTLAFNFIASTTLSLRSQKRII